MPILIELGFISMLLAFITTCISQMPNIEFDTEQRLWGAVIILTCIFPSCILLHILIFGVQ